MPWGLKRFYGSGDLHFITSSCYRRQAFLASERRRDLFLVVLEEVRQRYGFVVVGYVVMPEHFHLLLSEPEKGNPSVVMQALKLGFARRVLPTRRGDDGRQSHLRPKAKPAHVWQRRFYDYNVRGQHKRVEKLRYIHRNPVRRGLVKSPEQWRWSSFRDYAYGERGPVRVNDGTVLKMKVRRA
jgi:putative transposase